MKPPLRVVFCWAEVSGYMSACWRALAARHGIDLHILHLERLGEDPNPFDAGQLLSGLSHQMFKRDRHDVDAFLLDAVARRDPDVVVLCGWIYWPYTRLVNAPALSGSRKMLGMDSPWRGSWSQRLGRLRLGHVARALDRVVVAGNRTAEYARRIGVPEERIRSGYYGFDYARFCEAGARRSSHWPRRFLFAGRYVPEKDVATLVRAYEMYRQTVDDPWALTCCGSGSLASLLTDRPGITDVGFVPPERIPELFADHGAFVLPSRFEPWGVVIAEAAAAGLPVICSSACGAAIDIVRPYYNGVVVPPRDAAVLARAMKWIHDHEGELESVGRRGQALAEAFSAPAWAERWHEYMLEIVTARTATPTA